MVDTAKTLPAYQATAAHVLSGDLDVGDAFAADATDTATQPPTSAYEQVLTQGFRSLRFPTALEARYRADQAGERLRILRLGATLIILLHVGMIIPDWLMVPDRIAAAFKLRYLVDIPVALAWLLSLPHLAPRWREWGALVVSLTMAAVTSYLIATSTDALAAPYFVALAIILVEGGGVLRLRFKVAVCVVCAVLLMFCGALLWMPPASSTIVVSVALVLVSAALFTLFGCYRAEHEARTNWLMLQQEHLLYEALAQGNARLDQISRFDPLTGLANRRHFDEFISQVWARARRDGHELSLLMIDVDHFKAYNDSQGHPAGDACLKEIAAALTQCLRKPDDLIARFGGEEFIAVLTTTSLPLAMQAAQRVRDSVWQRQIPHPAASTAQQVTVSIGVATMQPDTPLASPARLIALADEALYQAKANGRNQVVASNKPVQASAGDTDTIAALPAWEREGPSQASDTGTGTDQPCATTDRADLDTASAWTEKTFSPMRFPAHLEQQFHADIALQRLRYAMLSGWLALIVFNGFLLADLMLAPDVFGTAVKVRVGLFTPPAIFTLLIGGWSLKGVIRPIPPWLIEAASLVSGVCAAACLAYILSISHTQTSEYYHVGLMVVIMYGNVVQRLRFWHAVVFSLAVYAMHVAGVLMMPTFTARLVLPMVALVGAGVVFTLRSNYELERDERRQYLLLQRRKQLLKDLGDVHQRLRKLSRMDALTGLYNRRHAEEYLKHVWHRAQHDGSAVALIMLDVDHFKKYNDRYGHPQGDRCLTRVSEALQASLRQPGDLVARWGGEEFLAILPNTDAQAAQQAAQRVREAVEGLRIAHQDATGPARVVTVSQGVASCRARPDQADWQLIAEADAALYQAKNAGRNRVVLAGH